MTEQVYVELQRFFDRMPGGFPATDSGVELKILERLFTPEDAKLVLQLRLFPEPPKVIAKRWGMSEQEAAEKLADLAHRGKIIYIGSGGKDFYLATQYKIGFQEFNMEIYDRELAEMAMEMEPHLNDTLLAQQRVIPIGAAIDPTSTVASYNQVRNLVKKQKSAAVAPCLCKVELGLLGKECSKPVETCMSFGIGADHLVHTGMGRRISMAEVERLIDRAEEQAMVLMPTNSRDVVHLCCCCGCCCTYMRMLNAHERPADYVRSAFQARVDQEKCLACDTCLERCQMAAITGEGDKKTVDLARCIGCGLCVTTCPGKAAMLVPKKEAVPPSNYFSMLSELAKERGLGFGKLNPVVKLSNLPLFVKMLPYMYGSGLAEPIVNQLAKRGWV